MPREDFHGFFKTEAHLMNTQMEYFSAKAGAPSLLAFFRTTLYF